MDSGSFPEKCGIFIDGGYLTSKLRDREGPRLDLLKLSNKISEKINCNRLRTYYYDCLPIRIPSDLKSQQLYNKKKRYCEKIGLLPRIEI